MPFLALVRSTFFHGLTQFVINKFFTSMNVSEIPYFSIIIVRPMKDKIGSRVKGQCQSHILKPDWVYDKRWEKQTWIERVSLWISIQKNGKQEEIKQEKERSGKNIALPIFSGEYPVLLNTGHARSRVNF